MNYKLKRAFCTLSITTLALMGAMAVDGTHALADTTSAANNLQTSASQANSSASSSSSVATSGSSNFSTVNENSLANSTTASATTQKASSSANSSQQDTATSATTQKASANVTYSKSYKLSEITSQNVQKTTYKSNAVNKAKEYVKEQGSMNEKMKVTNAAAPVYSAPAKTNGAEKLGTASSLGLTDQWLTVNYRKYTNKKEGYFRVTKDGTNYYIDGKYMEFNLSGLSSGNAKIEKAIKAGEALIGKSPYSWGGGRTAASIAARRFDCSSFIRYIYAKAGVYVGPVGSTTTYTLASQGRSVNYKAMKRGDIFFFNDKKEGAFCHVGIYLGRGLFLNDSPSTDTHGVGISSLQDPHWSRRFNHVVRRIV
ncbi:C40 family peptidase [Lactobacillus sp. Sy-1]|uniref:C40 family peptidase n=1 Tax=Lactobacillus sp. Sy-1 TaxID=2109645 RepID=UPI001C5A2AE8|nr:C40 family peptidase [Lactobacillus sp. Sy-1]MBW1605077.1 C40 family peptidase [Lactobacillus sp. Sy-1]